MPRVVKRSASRAVKAGPLRRVQREDSPVPAFVPPQLSQPVEKPPSGQPWVHEIKLDGFRMAARIDNGRLQLLTRTGLDWAAKCPSAIAALASVNMKTAYLDGELCGVDEAGLPSFAHTQAAAALAGLGSPTRWHERDAEAAEAERLRCGEPGGWHWTGATAAKPSNTSPTPTPSDKD